MAKLPQSTGFGDTYLSDNARTELQMKTALTDIRDVAFQRFGYESAELLTLASNSITPTFATVLLSSQTGAGLPNEDQLDTINTANFEDGQLVQITPATGHFIEITLAGNIRTPGGLLPLFTSDDRDSILLQLSGGTWYVINVFRDTVATARADFGLGDAALATEGSGNLLDADMVDGEHASELATVLTGRDAFNATNLGGSAATNYALKTAGVPQVFATSVESNAGVFVSRSAIPQFWLKNVANQSVGQLIHDGTELELVNYVPGGGVASGIELRTGGLVPRWFDNASVYQELLHRGDMGAGSGVDADTLDGFHAANICALGNLVISVNTASGLLAADTNVVLALDRASFFPDIRTNSGVIDDGNLGFTMNIGAASYLTPTIVIWSRALLDVNYTASWEHF